MSRKHVVFGKLLEGQETLKKMESVETESKKNKPIVPVKIVNCGEVDDKSHGAAASKGGIYIVSPSHLIFRF